jgi:hypothetical protein
VVTMVPDRCTGRRSGASLAQPQVRARLVDGYVFAVTLAFVVQVLDSILQNTSKYKISKAFLGLSEPFTWEFLGLSPCVYRKLDSAVTVMKAADDRL